MFWGIFLEIIYVFFWESNMACWKMDHLEMWFSWLETSVHFGDFPASHVWLPEGIRDGYKMAGKYMGKYGICVGNMEYLLGIHTYITYIHTYRHIHIYICICIMYIYICFFARWLGHSNSQFFIGKMWIPLAPLLLSLPHDQWKDWIAKFEKKHRM